MIGMVRTILDSMLLGSTGDTLTHDVLNTFMAEVCAIVNSRPLVPVSTGSAIGCGIYCCPLVELRLRS
jgi:hypothetical protein